jgi:hypothetical protein
VPQLSIFHAAAAAAAAAAAGVQSSGGHAAASAAAEAAAAEAEGGEAAAAAAKFQKESYDYLLSMQIWNLTYEKVQALQGDADTAAAEVARLEQADIRSMWIEDLENFLVEYEKWEEEANAAAALLVKQRKGAKGGGKAKGAAGGAKAGAKGKKANPWSDEESDEEEDMDYEEFKVGRTKGWWEGARGQREQLEGVRARDSTRMVQEDLSGRGASCGPCAAVVAWKGPAYFAAYQQVQPHPTWLALVVPFSTAGTQAAGSAQACSGQSSQGSCRYCQAARSCRPLLLHSHHLHSPWHAAGVHCQDGSAAQARQQGCGSRSCQEGSHCCCSSGSSRCCSACNNCADSLPGLGRHGDEPGRWVGQ